MDVPLQLVLRVGCCLGSIIFSQVCVEASNGRAEGHD
jgi:hypothetical protein